MRDSSAVIIQLLDIRYIMHDIQQSWGCQGFFWFFSICMCHMLRMVALSHGEGVAETL